MHGATPDIMEILLLSGYIVFSGILNFFALLISSFYEKSLQKASPKAGFIISIFLSIVFLSLYTFQQKGILVFQIISVTALLGSGLASILSILSLFFTMNKIQK